MTAFKTLLTWRAARWAALAAAIPALWACNSRRLEKPTPAPERIFEDVFQQSINRDIDIVFMIDTSQSMKPLQDKLVANFPTFMNVLSGLPGGLPNVHIAVVSSDIGAGKYDIGDIPQCRHGGDQGIFQNTPRGGPTCATGMLNAGQRFISSVNGMANFTGNIADVFTCIAALGDTGCGFEHVFGSVLRSLGADGNGGPPAENAGFLRDSAFLAIVLITNEDDCSAPINSDLFDPSSRFVSDPLGPLASYRCNEYGHVCGGQRPPRTPAGRTDLTGTCTSAEDGRLLRVIDVSNAVKLLKVEPSKILVAAIAGPPAPYVVDLADPTLTGDPSRWPAIQHSCMQGTGEYADPGIRIKEWVDSFGGNGVFQEICAASFAPALQRIAEEIGKKLGNPCVIGQILNTEGGLWDGSGGQTPDCQVVDHARNDQNVKIDSPLKQCAGNMKAGAEPCWVLTPPTAGCPPGSHTMDFNRPGGPVTTELNSSVDCAVRVCPPAGYYPPGDPRWPMGCG